MWRRVAWDNSFLRRFRAGRQVLALRTEDNSVLYAARQRASTSRPTPAQPVQLDGDEFGEAIRLRCRIVEGGVTVMVPRGHDTSRI